MRTLILILGICMATAGHAQKFDSWRWNMSGYYSTPEYTARANKSFWNWRDYGFTLDVQQFGIWGILLLSGYAHGVHEAFYADPYIFEKKRGVGHHHFLGSDGWVRNYWENNQEKGHKPDEWNWTRDVKHTSYFVNKTLLVGGTFAIGIRAKQPLKFRLFNLGLGLLGQSVAATITYNTIRYTR